MYLIVKRNVRYDIDQVIIASKANTDGLNCTKRYQTAILKFIILFRKTLHESVNSYISCGKKNIKMMPHYSERRRCDNISWHLILAISSLIRFPLHFRAIRSPSFFLTISCYFEKSLGFF